MRLISASSALPEMLLASKPSTQEPMRSISWRAGWLMEPKKSGSARATRSTGICSRANQTRIVVGMRSSARMAWNIRATISMIAFSLLVSAFFLSSSVFSRSFSATLTTPAGL
jgi:hypothetical protein